MEFPAHVPICVIHRCKQQSRRKYSNSTFRSKMIGERKRHRAELWTRSNGQCLFYYCGSIANVHTVRLFKCTPATKGVWISSGVHFLPMSNIRAHRAYWCPMKERKNQRLVGCKRRKLTALLQWKWFNSRKVVMFIRQSEKETNRSDHGKERTFFPQCDRLVGIYVSLLATL